MARATATTVEMVAITYALTQLGRAYRWGGAGAVAFDCSGLAMMARAQAGVTLLPYTGDQINEGTAVSSYADRELEVLDFEIYLGHTSEEEKHL
jgi:cell wall-associated NlpC family hydrolase